MTPGSSWPSRPRRVRDRHLQRLEVTRFEQGLYLIGSGVFVTFLGESLSEIVVGKVPVQLESPREQIPAIHRAELFVDT